jgi:NADH:ubiquinone oxidoreductase subunit C
MTQTITLLDSIPEKLGTTESWVEKGGVHWLSPDPLNVRELAKTMNDCKARFITITAYQLPGDQGFRMEYHWDLDGQLLGFPFLLQGNAAESPKIESIYDLCEAVDWIEREIHEGFAVEFTGREYEPLLLREGDKPGVNLRDTGASSKAGSGLPGQEEVKK